MPTTQGPHFVSNVNSVTVNSVTKSMTFDLAATQIAEAGRFLAERGWSPATSSNYSIRLSDGLIALTRSGIDKYKIEPKDVLIVNSDGLVSESTPGKSSAETLIHTSILKTKADAGAVLHTHSPTNTRLSLKYLSSGKIFWHGYEMQKGITGVNTHESELELPILPNSQNMLAFAKSVESLLEKKPNVHGFLIAGHGLYTWGRDMTETRRHVETYEFLMSCLALEISGV